MIKGIGVLSAILVATTTVAPAQGNSTQSAPPGAHPPQVLGPAGTMYNGNNANLQLPPEPNRYWADLWAAPISVENIGPGGAAAASAAASSGGGPSGAGVQ